MIEASLQSGLKNNQTKETFKAMFKMRLLIGLAAMVATLIVSAAPASAWFESNSTKTTGQIKTFPESTVFKTTPTGPGLECKNASGEPAGQWEILSEKEAQAKAGPHEQLKISKWGHCTGPLSLPLKISCSLIVIQATKNAEKPQAAVGGVEPGCQVGLENGGANKCIIKVSAQTNHELKEVKLANGAQNAVEIGAEVKGITSTIEETGGECNTLGIELGKEGTFKTKNPLVTLGQKLV